MTPAAMARAREVSRRAPLGARVAEIGFGVGKLAEALAATRPDLALVMVDNFLPAAAQPAAYRATRDRFAARDDGPARRARAERLAARMGWRLVVADSVAAADRVDAVDLAFIDGDHSEAGVARDLAAWAAKVVPNGWIGGHDYANADPRFDFSGVARAVDAWADGRRLELGENFTWWCAL